MLAELAELTQGLASQRAFRQAVTEHLRSRLGFDGLVWTPGLTITSDDAVFVWRMPRDMVLRSRANPEHYGELQRSVRRTIERGIAVNAGMSARECASSAWWSEVLRPLGVNSYIGITLGLRSPHTLVSIYRMGARPFVAADARTLRALTPSIGIGDELCARRERDAAPLVLTPREQQIAALVERGLTNAEIASVLGISANTVRNRLAAAFERTGAANRAELVARVRR